MCVIVVTKELAPRHAGAMYHTNPDGIGVLYSDKLFKTTSLEEFLRVLPEINSVEGKKVFHFRLATHGERNIENLHPFVINANGCKFFLFHNGVSNIPILLPRKSDTWHVGFLLKSMLNTYNVTPEKVLKAFLKNNRRHGKFLFVVNNKIIYNRKDFVRYGGMLCSNLYWLYRLNNKYLVCGK